MTRSQSLPSAQSPFCNATTLIHNRFDEWVPTLFPRSAPAVTRKRASCHLMGRALRSKSSHIKSLGDLVTQSSQYGPRCASESQPPVYLSQRCDSTLPPTPHPVLMSTPSTLRTFLDGHFTEISLNEPYQLIRELQKLHPNSIHIPVVDQHFPIGQFLKENNILLKGHRSETLTTYVSTSTGSGANAERSINSKDIYGLTSFSYKGTDFMLYKVEIEAPSGGCGPPGGDNTFWNFVYDRPPGVGLLNADAVGKNLVKEVYDWMHRPDDKNIWVFDRGQWYQDEELTKAVESASWDNLVLEESFVKGLQRDTSTFFSSEGIYESLGITWKRGILLLGNPQTLLFYTFPNDPQVPPGTARPSL